MYEDLNGYTCGICDKFQMANEENGNIKFFVQCGHEYCSECFTNYYKLLIDKRNSGGDIFCPQQECDTKHTVQQIRSLISVNQFQKYEMYLQKLRDAMQDQIVTTRSRKKKRHPCFILWFLFVKLHQLIILLMQIILVTISIVLLPLLILFIVLYIATLIPFCYISEFKQHFT